MPIQVQWENTTEKDTILWHIEGDWNADDFDQACLYTRKLMITTLHTVNVVIIIEDNSHPAADLLNNNAAWVYENYGTCLIVNRQRNHPSINALNHVFYERGNYPVLWVQSWDYAKRTLEHMRPTVEVALYALA